MDYKAVYAEATRHEWAELLDLIPQHMVDGMVRYLVKGIPPGSFLTAVLCNDLMGAMRKADDVNIHALPSYARFLMNGAPIGAFGSEENVSDWISSGGLAGLSK